MTRAQARPSPYLAVIHENYLRSMGTGKYADLVIIDDDLLGIEPHEISNTKTLMTLVWGKVVYDSGDLVFQ